MRKGFLDEPAMDRLVEAGAVGEILGQYYDAQGAAVSDPSLVTIGLSLDDLRASARVIAVAAGGDGNPAGGHLVVPSGRSAPTFRQRVSKSTKEEGMRKHGFIAATALAMA